MPNKLAALAALAIGLGGSAAHADDLPKGTTDSKPASKGTTEAATGGFESAKRSEDAKDATELSLSAGALSTSGNASSFATTGNISFRVRRGEDQLSGLVAANYARAKLVGQEAQTTVENEQARLRYDRFVSKHVVLFLGLQQLRDRFRGLEFRGQVDPGVGYYFITEPKEILWIEAGYDFMYDIRRDDARAVLDDKKMPVLDDKKMPVLLPKTRDVHSARLFFGYNYNLVEGVAFNLGLELLQALTDSSLYRMNLDVGLTSKLGKSFSLATTYSLKYDHAPLPGKAKIDNVTSIALVYNFF